MPRNASMHAKEETIASGQKIGIMSLYHNNFNYGGLLQAYALSYYLNSHGYSSEMIAFLRGSPPRNWQVADTSPRALMQKGRNIPHKIYEKLYLNQKRESGRQRKAAHLQQRQQAMRPFMENTPHSQQVYDRETIPGCVNHYDVFLSGSDQIWSPLFIQDAHVFSFLHGEKPCISYASSIATDHFHPDYLQYLKAYLSKYAALSVREKSTKLLLESLLERKVEWSVDPTLLVSAVDWQALCSENAFDGGYVFAYFLGDNAKHRKIVRQFARAKGLPIVTIPHLEAGYCLADEGFADINAYEASVNDFLSLIQNAAYVATDSYHATIFSLIFKRNFVNFGRNVGQVNMNNRVVSLLEMAEAQDRLVFTKDGALQAWGKEPDFQRQENSLASHIADSKSYLRTALSAGS